MHDFYASPLRLSENFVNFTEGFFVFTSTYDLFISINSRRFLDVKYVLLLLLLLPSAAVLFLVGIVAFAIQTADHSVLAIVL